MAALSHLVVGIAHELNTPIGTSLMASSYLDQQVCQLEQEFESGTLTRAHFADFTKILHEAAALNQANLQRASRLVSFFKEMAVNMEAEPPAPVNLRALVEDVIQRLKLERPTGLPGLVNNIPDGLVVPTYSVSLTRVVSNILDNAAAHAYRGRLPGTVTASASIDGDWVELSIYDDGLGIPESERRKVFEPFYTTDRGGGHVGLGLSIAFNLVTHRMGGTIQCQVGPNGDSCFVIRLPSGRTAHQSTIPRS